MSAIDNAPRKRRSSRIGIIVSLAFHAFAIAALVWMAREGMLGLPAKKLTVRLLQEPEPEKPSLPEIPKPKTEQPLQPKPDLPAVVAEPEPVQAAPPPSANPSDLPEPAPLPVAPPAAQAPVLVFDESAHSDAISDANPQARYRSFIEFSLRLRWNRPVDVADATFVAEVEVSVDSEGRVSAPKWKRKSGDPRWDASVLDAIRQTPKLDRPPPEGFPVKVTLRFDVVSEKEHLIE
jgi:TonB family protein